MKNLKHSKYRNTGLLFELLIKQISKEVLNNLSPKGISIVKKHFVEGSNLLEELKLYNIILNSKNLSDNDSNLLLNTLRESLSNIDKSKLDHERYLLVKSIKNKYNIEELLKLPIDKYKQVASIFKFFEYKIEDNPLEYLDNKRFICENLKSERDENSPLEFLRKLKKEDDQVKVLTVKLIADKFNKKYSNKLDENQKELIRKFVYEDLTLSFKSYLISEALKVKKELIDSIGKVREDQATYIKVKEVINLLENFKIVKNINENHVLTILRYYELLKEIKAV